MINFGPATITWESLNVLANGDFESWSSGNNANNWAYVNVNPLRENNTVYSGNSALSITATDNNQAYVRQYFNNTTKPVSYWQGRTVTGRIYARGNANKFVLAISYLGNNTGAGVSQNLSQNNNWTLLTAVATFNNNASSCYIYPFFYTNEAGNSVIIDKASLVEGPYNIGKTIGGGSIELYYHNSIGMYTKNLSSLIYGGEGVLHMFQWNNTIYFNNNSPMLHDYGKLTITCNNMTITIDAAKLFLSPSHSFGTYNQQPIDIHFSFKKSPDTGNYITIS